MLFIRELYPWCASLILTLLIYWTIRGEHLNFRVPLLLATASFTTAVGPITAIFTYCLCHPSLRKPWWFVQYSTFSLLIYTDAKNVVARVSLNKQMMGETAWRVTPRSATAPVKEMETPTEPAELDIEPVGDAHLSFMTHHELERSRSEFSGFFTDTINEKLQRSRERFWEELEWSMSSQSFIRDDLRRSTSGIVVDADVEQTIDRNHSSKLSGVVGQEQPLHSSTRQRQYRRSRSRSSEGEVPLADIPEDRPRRRLERPAEGTDDNRMARVEVPLQDTPEDTAHRQLARPAETPSDSGISISNDVTRHTANIVARVEVPCADTPEDAVREHHVHFVGT